MGYKKRLERAFDGAPVYHKKAHLFCEREVCFFSIVRPESACCRCLQELLFIKELSWNIQEVENDFI